MSATTTFPTAASTIAFDPLLLKRLKQSGPRYTSYPTADRFSDDFGRLDYLQAVGSARARGSRQAMSLYIHIPFCDTVCYYCACNKIVTKNRGKAETYLGYLKREIEMQGKLFAGANHLQQLHFGGGTPTYLTHEQLSDLMVFIRKWFVLAPDSEGEYSIEVDPRSISVERVFQLREQGFNRISLGVQDFDPEVQRAVNRVQSEQDTLNIIEAAREAGFRSVNVDLIYGLPKQNLETMAQTMDKVIAAAPDRIAIYNYAHLPHIFKPQRRINEAELPSGDMKLDMLHLCIKRLESAGYVYIGMDHFAKPDDDLAIAQRQGRLHRNFQGYSTHADADMLACGVSAISAMGGTYSQNEKDLEAYYRRIDNEELPLARGIKLTLDDMIRRTIIQSLMCNFEFSISNIEQIFPIAFLDYFAKELIRLQQLAADGLLSFDGDWICVSPKGRLLIRNICMAFDRYIHAPSATQAYSKTI